MLDAIVHHGSISNTIEYFATIVGPQLDRKFFFEQSDNGEGRSVRYFGGSSELLLGQTGVRFHGNGGLIGEYMFGGHFPLRDLLNDEVANRLILFGGIYDRDTGELNFTENTSGSEPWEELFLEGNAVSNYFFFLDEHGRTSNVIDRQETTLRTIGKLLKRSPKVGRGNFIALAHDMHDSLGEPDTTLFLVRVIHRTNQKFYEACREAYRHKVPIHEMQSLSNEAAREIGVEPYQKERIQIDVIYHYSENRELIDEYKRVLGSCTDGQIGPSERARLSRLRTLSLRNEIPLSIFDTLEEIVLQDRVSAAMDDEGEPDYIESTRAILESFMLGTSLGNRLSSSDMIQLLENKQKAVANRDPRFEEILLETGRMIDEKVRDDESQIEKLESFTEIVTLFDRFDHASGLISKLAFMDDNELSEEQVRSILGNMREFESLRRGLFQKLFIDPVASNPYTLSFGRRKLYALMIGLVAVGDNEATLADVADEIRRINHQERAFFQLYELARKRMSTFYLELNTTEGRDTFRREIVAESDVTPELADVIEYVDDKLIDEVITK
ncbi:MAG: TIGR04442 family protein, partial [Thermoanaerobaculia bacterium]|nr:TIGR04442 family protein [Thermoanaerobaculia bacterium]